MAEHVVDVIIPVHNDQRPVERAVRSALRNSVDLRISIIAHNVAPQKVIARLGVLGADPRVRVLPLADGVRSPANAFNHGLTQADAEYVSIIGSDDTLEAGALDAWVLLGDESDADAVIAPIVRDGGGGVPTPRIRRGRERRLLDADRDRVFERTAPLGLQRVRTAGALRYATGLPRGVDQEYGLRLWTRSRAVFDPSTPAYCEHADQADRVTHAFGPLIDDFAFLEGWLALLQGLSAALRRAAAAKQIRVHLVPAVRNRARADSLTPADLAAANGILRRLAIAAPGCRGLLPRSVSVELAAIEAENIQLAMTAAPRRAATFLELVPQRLSLVLHRHAPLRGALSGRRVARTVARSHAQRAHEVGRAHGRVEAP
jgi:hypothetical protein